MAFVETGFVDGQAHNGDWTLWCTPQQIAVPEEAPWALCICGFAVSRFLETRKEEREEIEFLNRFCLVSTRVSTRVSTLI